MKLTDKQLQAYRRLYCARFRKEISAQEALPQALALIELVTELAKNYWKNYDEHETSEVDK